MHFHPDDNPDTVGLQLQLPPENAAGAAPGSHDPASIGQVALTYEETTGVVIHRVRVDADTVMMSRTLNEASAKDHASYLVVSADANAPGLACDHCCVGVCMIRNAGACLFTRQPAAASSRWMPHPG